jgi:hypothetical protein
MSDRHSRHRWFVVGIFFLFMLLHQTDKLLIGPRTSPIMEEFQINEIQMGAVSTGELKIALLLICTSAWIICSIFYAFAAMLVPEDIKMLRDQLTARADTERAAHAG